MIRTITQAARYVDRVGFCLLFPIKGLRLPSLWAAVKGIPPRGFKLVAKEILAVWDKDAERLWRWKDELPLQGEPSGRARRHGCYFGRYFRGKKSLISLAFLPCFYRLAGNLGAGGEPVPSGVEGYERLYREGKITADARALCQQLYKHGPQATLELRYALGWPRSLGAKRANQRFKRALGELQQRLLIVHWGTKAETHAWESVVYQLTPRAFPKAIRAAASLSRAEARDRIAAQYRKLNPSATTADLRRLFCWSRAEAEAALAATAPSTQL